MTRQTTPSKPQHYSFSGLIPLSAPVPPMLEKAIGYTGAGRFVSFSWMPAGDEAYFDDGQVAGTGNWQAFLAYVHHPVILPFIRDYHLGSSDADARHSLILDRDERRLYVAEVKDGDAFLALQWPKSEPVHMSKEEWEAMEKRIIKAMKRAQRTINTDAIDRLISEQYALVEDLQHWLNQFLPN